MIVIIVQPLKAYLDRVWDSCYAIVDCTMTPTTLVTINQINFSVVTVIFIVPARGRNLYAFFAFSTSFATSYSVVICVPIHIGGILGALLVNIGSFINSPRILKCYSKKTKTNIPKIKLSLNTKTIQVKYNSRQIFIQFSYN